MARAFNPRDGSDHRSAFLQLDTAAIMCLRYPIQLTKTGMHWHHIIGKKEIKR